MTLRRVAVVDQGTERRPFEEGGEGGVGTLLTEKCHSKMKTEGD